MPAGIVSGIVLETKLLKNVFGSNMQHACHGPGPEAASAAAKELISKGATGLVSFGLAGSIDDHAVPGDLLLPEIVREGRDDAASCDPVWREALIQRLGRDFAPHSDPLVSTPHMVVTPEDKTALRYKSGAIGVDMESAAVGRQAADAGLPFVVIRAIADPHDMALPPAAVAAISDKGGFRFWSFIWALIRAPGQFRILLDLAHQSAAATSTLESVCHATDSNFAMPDVRAGLIRQLRAGPGQP